MSLTLNMVGGGGGGLSATDALLRVQAPAGSTVTISKGTTTKTDLGHENALDPTVYDYYFIIHQSQFDSQNAWTVTATDGNITQSDTVVIDAADEYDLVFTWIYAFKYGGTSDAYWGAMNVTHPQITTVGDTIEGVSPGSGNQWTVVWGNAFSSSRRMSKIYIDAEVVQPLVSDGNNYALKFGVSRQNDALSAAASNCVAYKAINTLASRQIYEFDVSSVTSGYLFVGGVGVLTVYNMWGVE